MYVYCNINIPSSSDSVRMVRLSSPLSNVAMPGCSHETRAVAVTCYRQYDSLFHGKHALSNGRALHVQNAVYKKYLQSCSKA